MNTRTQLAKEGFRVKLWFSISHIRSNRMRNLTFDSFITYFSGNAIQQNRQREYIYIYIFEGKGKRIILEDKSKRN